MPTVLVTGASRGIGLEFARQYAADGWRVIATCRDPDQATDLAALDGDIDIHALDVADLTGVDRMASALRDESIDVLLNNAGLNGKYDADLSPDDYAEWKEILATNAIGPFKVCSAFVEHVARCDLKRMVSISSRLGSIATIDTARSIAYGSSKAALNAAMRTLSFAYRDRGITVVLLTPGWVRTDMGGPGAALSPAESVGAMRRVIERLQLSDSGRFLGFESEDIPW